MTLRSLFQISLFANLEIDTFSMFLSNTVTMGKTQRSPPLPAND